MENSAVNKRKLYFVCQLYYPNPASTSQLFTPLMEKFSQSGWDVTVITSRDSNNSTYHNGVSIQRVGLSLNIKRSLLSRVVGYLAYLVGVFYHLLKVPAGSRVIGVTNPPFNAQALWAASKIKGFTYEYILLDLHPEGLVALGEIGANSLLQKVWSYLNRLAYQRAEKLYFLGRDMKALVCAKYGIDPVAAQYLPHWAPVSSQLARDFKDSKFIEDWSLSDKFVVQYSGNMGLWHDMDSFVRAAKELESSPSIVFVFIGNGIRREAARKLAEELHCNNIIWKDFVAETELTHSLAACHLSLLSLNHGLSGVAVPCKFYGIIAAARPVIALVPNDSEIAMAIREDNSGIVISPGDYKLLAQTISELAKHSDKVEAYSAAAFASYQQKYSIDQAYQRLMLARQ